MRIRLKDGRVVTLPYDENEVDSITFDRGAERSKAQAPQLPPPSRLINEPTPRGGVRAAPSADAAAEPVQVAPNTVSRQPRNAVPAPERRSDTRPVDRVIVEYQNVEHAFLKSEAEDLGSFHSPAGFVQKNLCDSNETLPYLTVCFRPDTDGTRDEVVFEYGKFGEQPVRLNGYTAHFYRDKEKVDTQRVERPHAFYQRWRWTPDGYRKRYRTVRELEEEWLVLPYRADYGEPFSLPQMSPFVYDGPLSAAGIKQYFPTTGERNDIGPFTEVQAQYLISQSEVLWAAVLAQAEGGMAAPWNVRDEGGTPIDWFRSGKGIKNRLRLNNHWNNRGKPNYLPMDGNGWHLDMSHQPALFYLPWILTGDPYYLEGMQFQNAYNTLTTSHNKSKNNLARLTGQYRAIAWNLRTLFQLGKTVPERVPEWLLGRAYYARQSKENSQYYLSYFVGSKSPVNSVLHLHDHHPKGPAFWQHDMLTLILGWGVLMGHADWKPHYEWAIENQIARVNGTSGWNRRFPSIYYLGFRDPKSWRDAWQRYAETYDKTAPASGVAKTAYNYYLRGVLAIATHLGTNGADSFHHWLHAQMGQVGYAKWAVAPGYALDGSAPPPLPDVSD